MRRHLSQVGWRPSRRRARVLRSPEGWGDFCPSIRRRQEEESMLTSRHSSRQLESRQLESEIVKSLDDVKKLCGRTRNRPPSMARQGEQRRAADAWLEFGHVGEALAGESWGTKLASGWRAGREVPSAERHEWVLDNAFELSKESGTAGAGCVEGHRAPARPGGSAVYLICKPIKNRRCKPSASEVNADSTNLRFYNLMSQECERYET